MRCEGLCAGWDSWFPMSQSRDMGHPALRLHDAALRKTWVGLGPCFPRSENPDLGHPFSGRLLQTDRQPQVLRLRCAPLRMTSRLGSWDWRGWMETQAGLGAIPALLAFARFCRNPAA